MSRPHFTRANFSFTCKECGKDCPQDSLLMVQWEKQPTMGGIRQRRRELCEKCGKLLLESLEPSGSTS